MDDGKVILKDGAKVAIDGTVKLDPDATVKLDQPVSKAEEMKQLKELIERPTPPPSKDGNVIKRTVTVFNSVRHGSGDVVSGWEYANGGATRPQRQFCYYRQNAGAPEQDDVTFLAHDRRPTQARNVPDPAGALREMPMDIAAVYPPGPH